MFDEAVRGRNQDRSSPRFLGCQAEVMHPVPWRALVASWWQLGDKANEKDVSEVTLVAWPWSTRFDVTGGRRSPR